MPKAIFRRVVLIGFMCSGKSSVGAILAERLGWKHVDLDREIERHTGSTIPQIFQSDGEAGFRALEAEATARVADLPGIVLTPGGGWVTNPALLPRLSFDSLVVWLRVSPEEVLARSSKEPGERPLLQRRDPRPEVERLMNEREPLYRAADLVVVTDGRTPAELASEIEHHIQQAARHLA